MTDEEFREVHPHQQAMRIAWAIWAALVLLVVIALAGLIAAIAMAHDAPPDLPPFMVFVAWAIVVVGVGVGLWLRGQVFKRYWVEDRIEPTGFITGHALLWGVLEAAAMFAIVLCFLELDLLPNIWPAAVALGFLLATYPTPRPMQAAMEL